MPHVSGRHLELTVGKREPGFALKFSSDATHEPNVCRRRRFHAFSGVPTGDRLIILVAHVVRHEWRGLTGSLRYVGLRGQHIACKLELSRKYVERRRLRNDELVKQSLAVVDD